MQKVVQKPAVKYKKYEDVRIWHIKNADKYELKRLYWLLNNYHRLLETDPIAVPFKQYNECLTTFLALYKKVNGDVGKRVDTGKLAQNRYKDTAADVGDPLPAGLGA